MIRIIQIVLIVMLFQDMLHTKIGLFSYLDEFLAVVCSIYAFSIYRKKTIKLNKEENIAFKFFIAYLSIGLLSSIVFKLIGIQYALLSMIMTVKGFMIYFSSRIIFENVEINKDILNGVTYFLERCIYILCVIFFLNLIFGFLEPQGERFGIETVSIGFSHPTELAFFTIISMSIILLNYEYRNKTKGEFSIIIASFILTFATGRSKAVGFMTIYVMLLHLIKKTNKFKFRYLALLTPIMILIGLPRIISELLHGARGYLYTAGIEIAKDYFPLGSGFGTFGSHISKVIYSNLYHTYGISNVWGLSEEMSSYITDTYWAMVIGETGFIGMIIILIVLYLLFIQFIKQYPNYKSRVIVFGLVCYTLVTSIAEPIYSSNKCAVLFMTLSLFITIQKKELQNKCLNNENLLKEDEPMYEVILNLLIEFRNIKIIGKICRVLLKVIYKIDIPSSVKIDENLNLVHSAPGLVIHPDTNIGKNVRIYQGVTLGRADIYNDIEDSSFKGIKIEDNSIICAGAKVLCKSETLTVGEGSVVGANAVLTCSTGKNEIWAGIPAKKIGNRK